MIPLWTCKAIYMLVITYTGSIFLFSFSFYKSSVTSAALNCRRFSTNWTSVVFFFPAMHYVYFVAARGNENTWMLIELIVNHSGPLFYVKLSILSSLPLLYIVCMKQIELLLILWHISSWLILNAKKQSACRTVSKPILPLSSSPSCYLRFKTIYHRINLFTKSPDFDWGNAKMLKKQKLFVLWQ